MIKKIKYLAASVLTAATLAAGAASCQVPGQACGQAGVNHQVTSGNFGNCNG